MDFVSNQFVFFFLPVVFLAYFITGKSLKNTILLVVSLAFYASGPLTYLPLILIIVAVNFLLGKRLESFRTQASEGRNMLVLGVVFNAATLLAYKALVVYGPGLSLDLLPAGLSGIIKDVALPLGLSYITFQNIAYLVDIYNERTDAENSLWDYSLYSLLFPKLLSGPIVLYRDLRDQLKERVINADRVANGARRFIIGFSRKVLIADTIGRTINPGFNLASPEFTPGIVWFMLLGYAVQLYFDFSGYTDMALGMGEMLGFKFVENFNHPYVSQSITDFWRRWHISLSSWVREYIFFPLEFQRRSVTILRQQTNIIAAFLVMGLWHGLTPNFILWALVHGLALALEMSFLGKALKRIWRPLRHVYTLAVVLLGWVFFRSNSLPYAFKFLQRLVGSGGDIIPQWFDKTRPLPIIDNSVWLAFGAGILFSLPVAPYIRKVLQERITHPGWRLFGQIVYDLLLMALFFLSVMAVTSAGFVGNIYGRF